MTRLLKAKLLSGLDAKVKNTVTGRTQDPEHMTLVSIHGTPSSISLMLGLVGDLQDARFIAIPCLTCSGEVGVSASDSVYDRICTSLPAPFSIVLLLSFWLACLESLEVTALRLRAAFHRTVLAISAARSGALKALGADSADYCLAQPSAATAQAFTDSMSSSPAYTRAVFGSRMISGKFTTAVRALKGPMSPSSVIHESWLLKESGLHARICKPSRRASLQASHNFMTL